MPTRTPLPIVQAPMAGAQDARLAIAVCQAGGLGSIPAAMLNSQTLRAQIAAIRAATDAPFNVNFFAHRPSVPDAAAEAAWRARLSVYYAELGVEPVPAPPGPARAPFDEAACALVEEMRPPIVSFHFGLPEAALVARVKATGAHVWSSATSVAEARWLEERGVDAIIAQGVEAGGHRGMFLTDDPFAQVGLFALLPQIVDAVRTPIIAAGGVADGRGVAAAFALGARAAQIGTAYLFTDEATTGAPHRAALRDARDDATRLTNLFTGRPARALRNRLIREQGPLSTHAPAFPHAVAALLPLRGAAERAGSDDFSPLWAGEAAALAQRRDSATSDHSAGALTRSLWRDAQSVARDLRLG